MMNDRPIEDDNLQAGLNEIQEIMARRGLAGCAHLVAPDESAFTYVMHAPWSAITADPGITPLGFRIRANSKEMGADVAHKRTEGAMHTICTMHDFATQTEAWMENLMAMMRDAGIDFRHTPHGGQPIMPIVTYPGKR